MKTSIKKFVSVILSATILSAMIQVTVGAEVKTDYNFTDISQTVGLANGGKIGDYTITAAQTDGKSGKDTDDKAYAATVAALPYSQAGSVSFQLPYFENNFFGAAQPDAVRTMELSVKYNENVEEAKLQSYISTNTTAWSWWTTLDWVTFKEGKIFVNNKDIGLAAKSDEWYRIVVEEHYDTTQAKVYINGKLYAPEFDTSSVGRISGNRWTQCMANVTASDKTGTRDVRIAIDDLKVYDEAYAPTGNETISYTTTNGSYSASTRELTVMENTSVSVVLVYIDTTAEKYMVSSFDANVKKESGSVADGDVVVLRSADKKTIEYVYIKTKSITIDYKTNYDFTDASQKLNLANGGKVAEGYTAVAAQVDGKSGKDADDKVYAASVTGLPYGTAGNISFELPYFTYDFYGEAKSDVIRTMELSVKYDENIDEALLRSNVSRHPSAWQWDGVLDWVTFKDGKIFVNGSDTGLVAKPNEWYRIAVEEHYDSTMPKVYINGQMFTANFKETGSDRISGNKWTQFIGNITANDKTGTRDGGIAIDDLKVYEGAYMPTGNEAISYTISRGNYLPTLRGFLVPDNATVSDVLGYVDTEAEKYVIDSLDSNIKKEAGAVSNGNVIVLKSADKKTIEYLHIYQGRESMIVDSDGFNASSAYTMFGDDTYANKGVTTGIYSKESTDYSFDMSVSNLPANVASENRYNFMANANLCSADSFTREFSIGADGDFDVIKLVTRCSFVDKDGNTTCQDDKGNNILMYQEPLVLSKDGDVNSGSAYLFDKTFKEKQWYRVAITIYPKECKYDLYLNNENVVTKEWLGINEKLHDSDMFDITSIDWFQIQPAYAEKESGDVRNGHVYVDDTITYYGEYYADTENSVEISSTEYTIDEEEGSITVPADTAIDSFAGNMDFGTSQPAIYTDNTYTAEVDDTLSDGNILIAVSANGLVRKYYTIKTEGTGPSPSPDPSESPEPSTSPDPSESPEPSTSPDPSESPEPSTSPDPSESPKPSDELRCDDIKIYVNDTETNTLAAGTVKATTSMYVPDNMPEQTGKLIIAVYKNGVLHSVKMEEKKATGKTDFEITTNVIETAGVTVKAFFWDNNMKPYVPFAECR